MSYVYEQLGEVARILVLSALVGFAYTKAKEAGEADGRWSALKKGVIWCVGVALFAAIMLGSPSCEDAGDGLHGCEQYADDGYDPSLEQRAGRFVFWVVLLVAPVVFGVNTARQFDPNPWRKPKTPSDDEPTS